MSPYLHDAAHEEKLFSQIRDALGASKVSCQKCPYSEMTNVE